MSALLLILHVKLRKIAYVSTMVSWYFIPELDRPKYLSTGEQIQALPVRASSLTTCRENSKIHVFSIGRQTPKRKDGAEL